MSKTASRRSAANQSAAGHARLATRRQRGFSASPCILVCSIYDSFFASRPHHHSHLWLNGGHRAARLRLRAASRFQSPPLAARASPRLSGTTRRRFSRHWRCGHRRSGGRSPLSRPGKPQRILRRSLAPAIQPLRVCLVRRISRRINRADNNGAPPQNSSSIVSRYLLARGVCRLRHRTHRLLPFRRRRLRQTHFAAMGYEFSQWRGAHDWFLGPHEPQRSLPEIWITRELRRSSDAVIRIYHLAGHRGISLADGHKIVARPQSARRDFCQLSDSYGRRALSDRVHPHQRSLVFRDVQRAKRELAVYPGWRGVTLAYQRPISLAQKRASRSEERRV